jgi:hypothetical protein
MDNDLKRLTVDLPEKSMEDVKVLSIIHKQTMREVIIKAVQLYVDLPVKDREMRSMKHKLYKIRYDKYEQ